MRFDHLSPSTHAIFWMLSSVVFFAITVIFIRLIAHHIHPFQIIFFRNIIGLFVLLPWFVNTGIGALQTSHLKLHIFRALLAFASLLCWYTALVHIPLAEATAISFMTPILASLAAILIFKEKNEPYKWIALFISFGGILIILQPGIKFLNIYSFLALSFALLVAASSLLLKILGKYHTSQVNVAYTLIFLTPVSLCAAIPFWESVPLHIIPWLITLAAASTLGHICLNKALAGGDVSVVFPFDYLRLPLISLLSYILFDEATNVSNWIGSILIFSASCYIAHQTSQSSKNQQGKTNGYKK